MIVSLVILGLIQGLTEFLPVSSSGHLALLERAFEGFGNFSGEELLAVNLGLHLATLAAVCLFLRRRIVTLFRERDWNYLYLVVIATVPTGLIGLGLERFVTENLRSQFFLTVTFLCTAVILYISRFAGGEREKITWYDALFIGIVQGVAVLPGLSRSGLTISLGMLLGIQPRKAADFSFIVSIPAIFGASILSVRHISMGFFQGFGFQVLVSMLVAFAAGYFSLKILYRVVQAKVWYRFAFYVAGLSLLNLVVF